MLDLAFPPDRDQPRAALSPARELPARADRGGAACRRAGSCRRRASWRRRSGSAATRSARRTTSSSPRACSPRTSGRARSSRRGGTAPPRLARARRRASAAASCGRGCSRVRARALRDARRRSAAPYRPDAARFDFRGGQVALETPPGRGPPAGVRRARSRRTLQDVADAQDPYGWPPLRREIARYLVGRGIACDADEVAVVNGAQQAIDLVARVLVDPGDTVVMEQPGYFGARARVHGRAGEPRRRRRRRRRAAHRRSGARPARAAREARLHDARGAVPDRRRPERRRGAARSLALADEHQVPDPRGRLRQRAPLRGRRRSRRSRRSTAPAR